MTGPGARRAVVVRDGEIRLGQFLKLAGSAGSGADAKQMLAAGLVLVNGELETRRGRRIVAGDAIDADGEQLVVGAG